MSQFETQLDLTLLEEDVPRPKWKLHKPLKYISNLQHRGRFIGMIIVPAGFVTDLASVPRLPVAWLLAGGVANRPSVVHDYLCSKKQYSSATAAKVFAEAMAAEGIALWRRAIMYGAVRCCGPYWEG